MLQRFADLGMIGAEHALAQREPTPRVALRPFCIAGRARKLREREQVACDARVVLAQDLLVDDVGQPAERQRLGGVTGREPHARKVEQRAGASRIAEVTRLLEDRHCASVQWFGACRIASTHQHVRERLHGPRHRDVIGPRGLLEDRDRAAEHRLATRVILLCPQPCECFESTCQHARLAARLLARECLHEQWLGTHEVARIAQHLAEREPYRSYARAVVRGPLLANL